MATEKGRGIGLIFRYLSSAPIGELQS